MKLDLDSLRLMALKLHDAFLEDGEATEQLVKGRYVYSITIDPSSGEVSAHVQWPYFKELTTSATYDRVVHGVVTWIYWTAEVQGIKLAACMYKHMLVDELKALGFTEISDDADIEDLLDVFQDLSGWNNGGATHA